MQSIWLWLSGKHYDFQEIPMNFRKWLWLSENLRKCQETSGNARKCQETYGTSWNFLKSPKLVFSAQSEKPHILRSGFNVPVTLPVIVRIIWKTGSGVTNYFIYQYIYLVCMEYLVVCMYGWLGMCNFLEFPEVSKISFSAQSEKPHIAPSLWI